MTPHIMIPHIMIPSVTCDQTPKNRYAISSRLPKLSRSLCRSSGGGSNESWFGEYGAGSIFTVYRADQDSWDIGKSIQSSRAGSNI